MKISINPKPRTLRCLDLEAGDLFQLVHGLCTKIYSLVNVSMDLAMVLCEPFQTKKPDSRLVIVYRDGFAPSLDCIPEDTKVTLLCGHGDVELTQTEAANHEKKA